jgi:hypothetical protein
MSSRRSRSGGRRIGEHGEAVVEILAPRSVARHGSKVAVRRGHPPHVHGDRGGASEPLEPTLLEDAEEFRLEGGLELADLVEEERPAIGELDSTAALRVRR